MLRIGIVGAENSHCAAIAQLCNVERAVSARVVSVWGEKRRFAEAAAEKGQIPEIVRDWRDMADRIDGVMIDHRHPGPHAEVAKYFIHAGVPTFIDKPFTHSLREAKSLWRLAERKRVPITSFSIIPNATNFDQFKKACQDLGALSHVNLTGPANLKSKYGGVFFYGIHQVEVMIDLLGVNASHVEVVPHGNGGGVAVVRYQDGPAVTLNLVNNGLGTFHWTAVGEKGLLDWTHEKDANPYLGGLKKFLRMFRNGDEPYGPERLFAPVAVLEAMQKSLDERRAVKVGKLSL